ncbi:MAG: hypothetical protein EKK45_10165, partial [Curvibacter sp.]
MCGFAGSEALSSIARLVGLVSAGAVPEAARPFVFGARLFALQKAGGGIRPIACGDVFRRIAARILAGNASRQLSPFLFSNRQVGVQAPCGAEAAQLAARRFAAAASEEDVVLKLDFKNAFNTIARQSFVEGVSSRVPALLPHVWAAYGAPGALFFGDTRLASSAGAQQGDPLGPLLFSIAAAFLRTRVLATLSADEVAAIRFEAAFLDDVSFGAPAPVARKLLDAFRALGPGAGAELNLGKTEVVLHQSAPPTVAALFPDVGAHLSLQSFSLLGAPCGLSLAAAGAAAGEFCARQARKVSLIGRVPDPAVAFALLRFCGAQPLGNFIARAVGPSAAPALEVLDAAAAAAFEEAVLVLPPPCLEVAALPARLGGLGLRRVAPLALLAFVAARAAATPLADKLVAPGLVEDAFAADLSSAIARFTVEFPAAGREAAALVSERAGGAQKRLTALREQEVFDRILAAASLEQRAR